MQPYIIKVILLDFSASNTSKYSNRKLFSRIDKIELNNLQLVSNNYRTYI